MVDMRASGNINRTPALGLIRAAQAYQMSASLLHNGHARARQLTEQNPGSPSLMLYNSFQWKRALGSQDGGLRDYLNS